MEWRYISRYDLYVSEHGNVKINGIELIPFIQTRGYYQIHIKKDNKLVKPLIHRLVAEAFLNMQPNEVVTHKKEKTNNHYSNLIVHTKKKAMRLAVERGSFDNIQVQSILTPEEVRTIRTLHPRGSDVSLIAHQHNVCKSTIQKILNGRAWARLQKI